VSLTPSIPPPASRAPFIYRLGRGLAFLDRLAADGLADPRRQPPQRAGSGLLAAVGILVGLRHRLHRCEIGTDERVVARRLHLLRVGGRGVLLRRGRSGVSRRSVFVLGFESVDAVQALPPGGQTVGALGDVLHQLRLEQGREGDAVELVVVRRVGVALAGGVLGIGHCVAVSCQAEVATAVFECV
jgi:hypothetical protein